VCSSACNWRTLCSSLLVSVDIKVCALLITFNTIAGQTVVSVVLIKCAIYVVRIDVYTLRTFSRIKSRTAVADISKLF